mmetsp:Transcript_113648/g.270640  ORF Transcript_113648/g.270640 Transcript_113648/m.270640 type:complete len:226 (-) Transcript_113648:1571-2248(-)
MRSGARRSAPYAWRRSEKSARRGSAGRPKSGRGTRSSPASARRCWVCCRSWTPTSPPRRPWRRPWSRTRTAGRSKRRTRGRGSPPPRGGGEPRPRVRLFDLPAVRVLDQGLRHGLRGGDVGVQLLQHTQQRLALAGELRVPRPDFGLPALPRLALFSLLLQAYGALRLAPLLIASDAHRDLQQLQRFHAGAFSSADLPHDPLQILSRELEVELSLGVGLDFCSVP